MPLRNLPQIANLRLFQGCSSDQIQTLLSGAGEKALKHRQVLYRMGDPVSTFSVVIQGAFKLVRSTPEGNDMIMHFATPGDVIGALVMSQPGAAYPVTVVAMGASSVLTIPQETYAKSWALNPTVQQFISGMLYNRMNLLHDQKALNRASLRQKIASLLVSLIERYSGEEETILPVPLTRQEIADAVGASVESVIRAMSDWSQRGIIQTSDQYIQVLSMGELLEILKSQS